MRDKKCASIIFYLSDRFYKNPNQKTLKRTILSSIIILFLIGNASAQRPKVKNLPNYDDKLLHFGFTLGLNNMDFSFQRNALAFQQDSLFADVSVADPGFHVLIVSDLRLGPYFNLRFQPGISFGQRKLNYLKDGESVREMTVASNYLDFPLLLKYKAKRINNFRPYLIGGVNVRYDMAARKDYDEESNVFVRLEPLDFYYELGMGLDFYLTYFKFATELKLSVGFKDVLVHEPAPGYEEYVRAIDRLTSRLVVLSFHFE